MSEFLKQPEVMPYLTVIEGRKPKQKLHKRISDAKNAFDTPKPNPVLYGGNKHQRNYTHGWGQLYEWVDGEWKLLYDVRQPTAEDYRDPAGYGYGEFETRPWKLEK